MAETGAFEIRRGDRVYRASSVDVLVKWATERRIDAEDPVRHAGGSEWIRAADLPEISRLLDPASWWFVRMGEKSYTAPDFETVVRWTREGRLTSDSVIEGPRTPPGGVLAQGLPRLSPFLRPPREVGDDTPPRLRIDGIEYHPGDIDSIRRWIADSRVPVEAEISLSGGPWEPVTECGAFEPELWPAGAWGERTPDEPADEAGILSASVAPEPDEPPAGSPVEAEQAPVVESPPAPAGAAGVYRILSGRGEIVVSGIPEIRKLLKKKRIHSFDAVLEPGLPEGRSSVGAILEGRGRSRRRGFPAWAVWVVIIAVMAIAFFIIDPLDTGYLRMLLEKAGIAWM